MNWNLSLDFSSTESDVNYVERSSEDGSPVRHKTPAVLNSTQLSGTLARKTITISSVASPQPQIVTDSDSNEPTLSHRFSNQRPIVPLCLNDLNDVLSPTVAAHLRGMRPAPTSKKDTLMLREKLKHYHYYSKS